MSVAGEVRNLRIVRELESAIQLKWKKPVDGGRPAGYHVQRGAPGTRWKDVATAMHTRIELEDQARGVELEYRVVAFNKMGSGGPSGTVRAVL
ncbi:MAG: fibronectin type III domain-containing protein [Gemmatimonadales bacterium]